MLKLVPILSILLSVLTDAAYALIVGTLLTVRWVEGLDEVMREATSQPLQPIFPQQLQRRLLLLCTAALVLAHLARPWFLAASMSGSSDFHANLALIPTILSSTHQGTLWYWNSFALAVLLLGSYSTSLTRWLAPFSLLLIAFCKAATGHAADQGDFTLIESLQAIHILSTAIWAGTVLLSGLYLLRRIAAQRNPFAVWQYCASLSATATYALAAVLITGIYTSDKQLNNTLTGLTTTTWGKVLVTKIVFVLLALTLGAITRFRYLRAHPTPARATHILRLLSCEAVAMAIILCLSGALSNNAPPMSAM